MVKEESIYYAVLISIRNRLAISNYFITEFQMYCSNPEGGLHTSCNKQQIFIIMAKCPTSEGWKRCWTINEAIFLCNLFFSSQQISVWVYYSIPEPLYIILPSGNSCQDLFWDLHECLWHFPFFKDGLIKFRIGCLA